MENKLIMGIIAIVLAIISIGSILAPVINDAMVTIGYADYTNDGVALSYYTRDNTDYEITPSSNSWLVNGDVITSSGAIKSFYTDTMIAGGTGSIQSVNVDCFALGIVVNNITTITLASDGVATFSKDGESYTTSWRWFALSDDNGDYVITNGAAYVPTDTTTHFVYPINTIIPSPGFGCIIDVGNTTSVVAATRSGTALTDVSDNVIVTTNKDGLKTNCTASINDSTYILGAIAPKIVAVQIQQSTLPVLAAIIPMMVIVVLMIAARLVLVKKE